MSRQNNTISSSYSFVWTFFPFFSKTTSLWCFRRFTAELLPAMKRARIRELSFNRGLISSIDRSIVLFNVLIRDINSLSNRFTGINSSKLNVFIVTKLDTTICVMEIMKKKKCRHWLKIEWLYAKFADEYNVTMSLILQIFRERDFSIILWKMSLWKFFVHDYFYIKCCYRVNSVHHVSYLFTASSKNKKGLGTLWEICYPQTHKFDVAVNATID